MTHTEARAVLELPPAFDARDLKRAYRRAAAAHHPDRGGTTARMVVVNEAYEVLSAGSDAAAGEPWQQPAAWSSADAEAFYRETGHQPERPSERYIRIVSMVLAAAWWITGIVDVLDEPRRLRPWILIGLPFSYLIVWLLVRCVVGVGMHVYNAGVWLRERIAPARSWHSRA